MRAALAERETAVRYPIRRIFFGCCAWAISTTPTNKTKLAISPAHFRFWILDFRLSEQRNRAEFENSFASCFSPQSKIGNPKSKMLFNDSVRPVKHRLWNR